MFVLPRLLNHQLAYNNLLLGQSFEKYQPRVLLEFEEQFLVARILVGQLPDHENEHHHVFFHAALLSDKPPQFPSPQIKDHPTEKADGGLLIFQSPSHILANALTHLS